MVKKLFKYEIAAYLRVWLPVELLLLVVSIFGRAMQIFESDTAFFAVLMFFSVGIYLLCVTASIVFNLIYSFIRYYKNLFTSEGYLSFTLPITASQHIFVKVATSVLFSVASIIMAFVSFCIISAGDLFVEVMRALGYLINLATAKVGFNFGLYVIEAIIFIIVNIIATRLLHNTCITIGQKANKGRIGFAILTYFIIYVITQTIISIIQFVCLMVPENAWEPIVKYLAKNYIPAIHIGLLAAIVITAVISLIYFLICRKIITKKLNLQ